MRRWARTGALLAGLVVLLLSQQLGRADPTQDYRPELPPDALTTGCYPLPGGVRPDFPYQVRRDRDVTTEAGPRRRLEGQYDVVDEQEALAALVADFEAVGFRSLADPGDHDAVLRRPGGGPDAVVRIRVEPFPGVGEESLVRGTFELDLPVHRLPPDAPAVCHDAKTTKRWSGTADR
ncbi:hypothetical protein [Nocardioides sp. TF02-7]|uniref:hypothetical protein n=1 Tax=Nocardioides sp. TF02-7 TaxID=2917724 RepID=UPI001F06894D|nr:hypothetical protein [Nocardioides sp. TF02-7]UMG93857.1 hypothetical protein MF408_06935 [Nocardioides sp. TF02-7]